LQTFLAQHERASVELVHGVAASLERSATKLAPAVRTPYRTLRPDADDALMEEIATLVHQLPIGPGKGEQSRRVADIAARAPHPISLSMLITRGLTFPNSSRDRQDAVADPLGAHLAEAVEFGVDEVGLYAYSLLTDVDVRLFMAAFEGVRAR
jgi:hypothetical protein